MKTVKDDLILEIQKMANETATLEFENSILDDSLSELGKSVRALETQKSVKQQKILENGRAISNLQNVLRYLQNNYDDSDLVIPEPDPEVDTPLTELGPSTPVDPVPEEEEEDPVDPGFTNEGDVTEIPATPIDPDTTIPTEPTE